MSFAATPGRAESSRQELFYGMAQGSYLVGDLKAASNSLTQILRIDPLHIPALKLRARIALDRDEGARALETVETILSKVPDDREAKLLKALALETMGRSEEALSIVEGIRQTAPPGSEMFRAATEWLGLRHLAEGEWAAATERFEAVHRANPEGSQALELLAESYLEQSKQQLKAGQAEAALATLDAAIAHFNTLPGAAALARRDGLEMVHIRTLARLGRFDNAINKLQARLARRSDDLEARLMLASLYATVGRWPPLEDLLAPLASEPSLRDVVAYLEGRAAFAQGRMGTARRKFTEALAAVPTETPPARGRRGADALRPSTLFYLGRCLQALGRTGAGQARIMEALGDDFRPETAEEAVVAARACLAANRPNKAIPILEAILLNRVDPSAALWAMLGRAHKATGSIAAAISAFNESLRLEPSQADTLALRASLLRRAGDPAKAREDAMQAIQIEPDNAALRYFLALVELETGAVESAARSFAKAADSLPPGHPSQLFTALLQEVIGRPGAGRRYLERYAAAGREPPETTVTHLRYALSGAPTEALKDLRARAAKIDAPARLAYFADYCAGALQRHAVLSLTRNAPGSNEGRRQRASLAYWMGRHEARTGSPEKARALYKIAAEAGADDQPEALLARWLLAQTQEVGGSPES